MLIAIRVDDDDIAHVDARPLDPAYSRHHVRTMKSCEWAVCEELLRNLSRTLLKEIEGKQLSPQDDASLDRIMDVGQRSLWKLCREFAHTQLIGERLCHAVVLVSETAVETQSRTPDSEKQADRKSRNRGPSAETLDNCQKAMGYWLDDNLSIKTACERTGSSIAPVTVRKYIEIILEKQHATKRRKWIKMLVALKEHEHLGKYKQS